MNVMTKAKCGTHILAISGALLVTGCAFVSHYDSMSYKQLTDLKGETKVFFENCQSEGASGIESLNSLKGFKMSSAKAYEYEKGKSLNDDTVERLEIIDNTISDIIERYKSNIFISGQCKDRRDGTKNAVTGCLTEGYCTGKWKALSAKFDIAISTENAKIKDKQQ